MTKWMKNIKPNPGDHIRVKRFLYFHHGIYVSDDEVIHFTDGTKKEISLKNAKVRATSLKNFLFDGRLQVASDSGSEKKEIFSSEEIIERARSRLGEKKYSLVFKNCEHFTNWCVSGKTKSSQVRRAVVAAFTTVIGSLVLRKITKK